MKYKRNENGSETIDSKGVKTTVNGIYSNLLKTL